MEVIPIVVDFKHNGLRAVIRYTPLFYSSDETVSLFEQLRSYDGKGLLDGGVFRGNEWESERRTIQIADPGVPLYKYHKFYDFPSLNLPDTLE